MLETLEISRAFSYADGMTHADLENKLGYSFTNKLLLQQALTHPSFNSQGSGRIVYERLEFLGDAVLELAVTQELYLRIPDQPEGILTHMRSRIVSREHLAKMGFALGLDQLIRLGKGEEQTGGRMRMSIIANTFETVFGAISLDSNYERARQSALSILGKSISEVSSDLKEDNPKGELQSLLQKIYPESPGYETEETAGDNPESRFKAVVSWRGVSIGAGFGTSKKKAEVAAAFNALQLKSWKRF